MHSISSQIEIDAPPETVWAILTDFGAYPAWSPFLERIEGPLEPGARLRVRLQPPGGAGITLRPRLLAVSPPHELRWLGRLGLPWIFDGEHRFEISTTAEGRARFVQAETFRGLLVPLLPTARRRAEAGFGQFNAALKARAEAQAPSLAAATRAATSTGSHTGENGGA